MFSKYHYLNKSINKTSRCFVGMINDIPVSFCAVLHFPHPRERRFKRCHRLVVLPDYQGVGIGKRLLNFVAEKYVDEDFRFIITTSQTALVKSFKKDTNWKLKTFGRKTPHKGVVKNTSNNDRLTTSWEFADQKAERIGR